MHRSIKELIKDHDDEESVIGRHVGLRADIEREFGQLPTIYGGPESSGPWCRAKVHNHRISFEVANRDRSIIEFRNPAEFIALAMRVLEAWASAAATRNQTGAEPQE